MHLPFFIARRYLFAKKSHNVINIISLISSVGIGIGSMALIIILSVYNGFDTLVKSFYQEYQPDFIITPSYGKIFRADSLFKAETGSIKGIDAISEIVEETVFIQYGNSQSIAVIKGVEPDYHTLNGMEKSLVEGKFKLFEGDIPHAVIGRALASGMRLRVRFVEPLEIYFPNRKANISVINPAAGLNNETVYPSGIISLNNEFDQKCLFIPVSVARNLLSYENDYVTSVEVYLSKDTKEESARIGKELEEAIGKHGYTIKNRYEQNETLYKMMRAEKFAVYLILFFVILIVSVNIFGSLSMLIIDKKNDMQTYGSIGAPRRLINRIFILQGWLISLIGAAAGIAVGLILCLIQQEFGVISMPGNYIISSYPVHIKIADVFATFFGVAIIGYIIAVLPVRIKKF